MADDGSHGAAARDDDDGLVRVISYNVLSPELSDPASFPENTPDECDGRKRLPRVLRLLEGAAASGAVIALQEVSQTWLGAIHAFFDARGYHYTHTLYGSPFSGYMGVGMAFPRALYALETLEVCRIADTKPWPRRRPHGESRGGRGGERRGRPGRAAVRERPQSSSSAERGVGGAAGAGGGGGTGTGATGATGAAAMVLGGIPTYLLRYARGVLDPLFLLAAYLGFPPLYGPSQSSARPAGDGDGGGGGVSGVSRSARGGGRDGNITNSSGHGRDLVEESEEERTASESKKRYNQAILLRLRRRSDGQVCCFATYHNP